MHRSECIAQDLTMFDAAKIVDLALDNPFTEDQLALRFSERHAHDLRYVAIRNQWYKWDGIRWAPESTLLAFDLARASCREDARDYGNGKPPNKLYTAKTVAAVQQLARADRRQAASLDQFDTNTWLITTTDATYDLRTGVGRPPDPLDYITKKTACHAAPAGTPHPLWSAFLKKITAEKRELQTFLQRYFGYCLTGEISEHSFGFGYGTGANGKSTLINTVAKILGDYACVADMATFIAAKHERHPTDLAKLHGHRLVIAQETQKGRVWDETKIKALTGGDKITARFMHQDFFDFTPHFKLFITGNHKPRLETVDEAMRRRLKLVPFTVQIPEKERDTELADKLVPEHPAILRWMIDGCLEWQRIGLAPPAIVTGATAAYFDDQDVIQHWLDECTKDGGPYAFTLSKQLYASWKHWTDEQHLEPGSLKTFSEGLEDRGFMKKRDAMGRQGFAKLVLASGDDNQEEQP
jgi:putative DNA primase/helicase